MRGNGLLSEKGARKALGRKLGAALAGGVRVVPAQAVGLAVAVHPLAVLVALVAGDNHNGAALAGRWRVSAAGLQQVHRAHDVGGEGACGIGVGGAHQGLCGHVDDNLGVEVGHGAAKARQVEHVGVERGQPGGRVAVQPGEAEKGGGAWRIEGIPQHLGPGPRQQQAHPRALEARVPGDEHPAAPVESIHDAQHGVSLWAFGYQSFQPARPSAHSLFRYSVSRRVSMQDQKPWWR